MTVYDIYRHVDTLFPFSSAAEYDNVGLLIGDMNAPVSRVLVTLDCTKSAAEKAKEIGANLIVTHHPVIFEPLKQVLSNSVVHFCIKNGINVISAHTNVDMGKGGINDKLCEILALTDVEPLDCDGFTIRKGVLATPVSAEELAMRCEKLFKMPIRFTNGGRKINSVAVCSGSGGGMLSAVIDAKCDAYVTSDVKHSQFISAYDNDLSIFDCGHFNTEDIIVEPIKNTLSAAFPQTDFVTYHGKEISNTCDFGGKK